MAHNFRFQHPEDQNIGQSGFHLVVKQGPPWFMRLVVQETLVGYSVKTRVRGYLDVHPT